MKTNILIGTLVLIAAIQFLPFGKEHINPQIVAEPAWDSPQTRTLFMRACGDCHSNETAWPWYSHVAPVSWLVAYDVEEGREHFNISVWGHQKKNKGDEAAKEMEEGEMPPIYYLPAHPEAWLNSEEKSDLIAGLKATFGEEKE